MKRPTSHPAPPTAEPSSAELEQASGGIPLIPIAIGVGVAAAGAAAVYFTRARNPQGATIHPSSGRRER